MFAFSNNTKKWGDKGTFPYIFLEDTHFFFLRTSL